MIKISWGMSGLIGVPPRAAHSHAGALFPPLFEFFNLTFPLVFVFLTVLWWILKLPLVDSDISTVRHIVAYVFLNSTHVGFTFMTLLILPEARKFLRLEAQAKSVWIVLFGCFFLALVVFYAAHFGQLLTANKAALEFTMALLLAYGNHHVLAQVFGLSLMYDQVSDRSRAAADAVVARRLSRLHARERRLFELLLAVTLILNTLIYLHVTWAITVYVAGAGILVTGILLTAWQIGKLAPSRKFIYLCRLPFCLLNGVFLLGDLPLRALHGVEYLFVTQNMLSASSIQKSRWFYILFWAGAILIFPASILLVPPYLTAHGYGNVLLVMVAASPFFMENCHYFLDSVLFRFKDPVARRWIGPLIFSRAAQ